MKKDFFTKRNIIVIGVVAFLIVLIGSILSFLYVKSTIIDNLNFEVIAEKSTDLGVETNTNFIITSEKNYSAKALKKVVALNPKMDFSLNKVDKNTYLLTPSDTLKDNSIYNISISKNGEKIDKSWAFQTKVDFKVSSTMPVDGSTYVNSSTGIEIYFSKPIENIDGFFEIFPKVTGNFEYKDKCVIFKPSALSRDTLYEITIKKGLKNIYGEEFLEDYSFSFRTDYDSGMYFDLIDGYQSTFRTDEVPDIKVSTGSRYEGAEIGITVYKLNNLQEYVNFLEIHNNAVNSKIGRDRDHLFDMTKYPVLLSFTGKIGQEDNSWINLIRFPETLEKGWYIVDGKSDINNLHFQKAIQISDISVYTYGLNGEINVWCNDTEDGEYISGATVQVGDLASITNKNGLAQFNLTDAKPQRLMITARNGKEFGEYISLTNEIDNDLKNDYYTYIYTDRQRYFPTDTINFWGTIIPRKSTTSMPEKVTVEIDERELELNVSENGIFSGKVEISNHSSTWLNIKLKSAGKETYLSGIEILDYTKPVYKITSSFDKDYYRRNEPINLNIYGKFYDGTSAENLKLDVKDSSGKNKSVTLDSNGEGKVVIESKTPNTSGYFYVGADIKVSGIDEYASNYNSVLYFPTDYALRNEWDSKNGKIKFNTNKYNYDAIENGSFNYEKIYSGESFDQKVYVDIVEVESFRVKTGEIYNYYTGLVQNQYEYRTRETVLSSTEVNIQKDKEEFLDLSYLNRRKNCHYEAHLTYVLPDSFIGYNEVYLIEDYDYDDGKYHFKRDDGYKNAKIGDSVNFTLDGENLPSDLKMLYFVSTDRINTMGITKSNNVKVKMEKDLIPNCLVSGVVFDGKRLKEISKSYLYYDTTEKNLDIKISTDKEVYKPGEKVTVNILVKDKLGNPVKTEMVVSAIDEAAYVEEYSQEPLNSLYESRYYYPKTFISNYCQSFEGGEGGGGGDDAREEFVNILLFESISTNEKGRATVEFTTSDDLTSWRITAVAVLKDDIKAGMTTKNISTSIPFFVNQVINEKYTVNDDVVLSLRTAGNEKKLIQGNIKYQATIEDGESKEIELEPSKTAMFNFGKLPAGKYKVAVKAESGEYSDAIRKEIEVVESNSELSIVKEVNLLDIPTLNITKYPIKMMFFDRNNGLAYKSLKKVIEQSNGSTTEQIFAKNFAYSLLNEFYDEELYNVNFDYVLQDYSGGIRKMSYSEPDSLITANICMIAPEKINTESAIKYFYKIINDSKSASEDVSAAYMGLAALKEPVLNDIKYLLDNNNGLELIDEINLISALAYIGDYNFAQKYYEDKIQGIMTVDKEYKYIGNDQKTADYKINSRLLTILSLINHNDFEGVLNYVLDNSGIDYISALDLLVVVTNNKPMNTTDAWFSYDLNGETKKVNFKDKKLFVLNLNESEMKSFNVNRSKGDIDIITEYIGKASENADISDEVKITKTISDGKLGEYSEVTLKISLPEDKEGYYVITDFVPLSSRYAEGGYVYHEGWGVTGYEKQKVNFYVNSKEYKEYTINYKIRNVFSGEFLAESAFATDSTGKIIGKSDSLLFNVK